MRQMSPLRHGHLTLVLAALLALALLAGCGGGDEDSTTGESTTATAASPGGADEGSEAGGADGDSSQEADADEPSRGEGSASTDGSGIGSNSANPGEGSAPTVLRKAKEFGSEATGSEAEEAEAVLLAYLEAQAGGDWSTACSFLTEELRKLYARLAGNAPGGPEGCPGFVETTTERLSPSERSSLTAIDIHSVRIEGDSGYIVYTGGSGTETAKPVRQEASEWKLSSLLATLIAQARSRE